jgi:hypothetical protein
VEVPDDFDVPDDFEVPDDVPPSLPALWVVVLELWPADLLVGVAREDGSTLPPIVGWRACSATAGGAGRSWSPVVP